MKKLICAVLALVLIFALAACGSSSQSSAPASSGTSTPAPAASSSSSSGSASSAPEKVYELKWGHTAADNYPYDVAADKVAEIVEERTNGAVKITVYPSNQLGNQAQMTESLITGVIDIVNTSSSVLSAYSDAVQVLDFPFLFANREHAYRVLDDPEITSVIFEGCEDAIGPMVSIWENGVRDLFATDRPIYTPSDCKGMKMRVMESKPYIRMAECLGASATPMAYSELYTALSQGTVDAADNPVPGYYNDGFYEVSKYLTLSEHSYSISAVIVSPKLKDKIGEENYQILWDTINEYKDWEREFTQSEEARLIEKVESLGCTVIRLSDEEKQAFADACAPIWGEFSDAVPQSLIDAIQAKK